MSKEREVYAEVVNTAWINPFATFKLRMSEVNRVNALINRDEAKPIVKDGFDAWSDNEKRYVCPICKERVHEDENFCKFCGQRLDQFNIAL